MVRLRKSILTNNSEHHRILRKIDEDLIPIPYRMFHSLSSLLSSSFRVSHSIMTSTLLPSLLFPSGRRFSPPSFRALVSPISLPHTTRTLHGSFHGAIPGSLSGSFSSPPAPTLSLSFYSLLFPPLSIFSALPILSSFLPLSPPQSPRHC